MLCQSLFCLLQSFPVMKSLENYFGSETEMHCSGKYNKSAVTHFARNNIPVTQ